MAAHHVELNARTVGTVTVVSIQGKLDATNAQRAREELATLAGSAVRVVVDLSQLSWIDSSGVGALISLYRRVLSDAGQIKVAGLGGQPKEIFRLLRLEAALQAFASVDEAISHLGS